MFLTPIETLLCARSWGVLSRTLRCLFRTIQTDQFLCACPSLFLFTELSPDCRLFRIRKFSSCSRMLDPDGCTGADHHFRRFNDTNLSPPFSLWENVHKPYRTFSICIRLATNYLLGRVSYIRGLLASSELLFWHNVLAQSALWSEIPDSNRPFQFGRLTC